MVLAPVTISLAFAAARTGEYSSIPSFVRTVEKLDMVCLQFVQQKSLAGGYSRAWGSAAQRCWGVDE